MELRLSSPSHGSGSCTNREEQRVIEAVLQVEGFLRWKHIELDGDEWEFEGAVAADGRKYDLRLDARTLEIVERHRD